MKKTISIFAIVLMLFMSGCGAFRNTRKNVSEVKRDSITLVDSSVRSNLTVVDKSLTTVREVAQGTTYTKPIKSTTKSNLSDLMKGLQIKVVDGLVRIEQVYDSLNNEITTTVNVDSQAVNYYVDRTTTTQNDIASNQETKTDLNKKTETERSDYNLNKESEGKNSFWVTFAVVAVFAIAAFFLFRKIF